MAPRFPAPHTNPRNILLRLRLGTFDAVSFGLKACSFSLHFLSLNDIFRRENLRRSLMKAFRTESALASFICRARLMNTSSTPMSFLAEVSKNGQDKVAAIFFPSRYETSRSSSKSHYEKTNEKQNGQIQHTILALACRHSVDTFSKQPVTKIAGSNPKSKGLRPPIVFYILI